MKTKVRILALYLPQYYPTKENNDWWGPGFTEWTNVAKAKPLFHGHYQPKIPADLGFYDLRVAETRELQTNLARNAGIEGFAYWHYWFAGKRMLERPFNEVIETGKPNYPFCLFWANHSWYAKTWDKNIPDRVLIGQTYPGEVDYVNHFNFCLRAFKDPRYILKDNKPFFGIYSAETIPNLELLKSIWNKMAVDNGFDGIYFASYSYNINNYRLCKNLGLDENFLDLTVSNCGSINNHCDKNKILNIYKVFLLDLTMDYNNSL